MQTKLLNRRKTDAKQPNPFEDLTFGRFSIGTGSMEFRRLFDQNMLRHTTVEKAAVPSPTRYTGSGTNVSEGPDAIAPPEGTGYMPIDVEVTTKEAALGTDVLISNPPEVGMISRFEWGPVKTIIFNEALTGTFTIYWDHKSGTALKELSTRVYHNGVAYGVIKSTTSTTYATVSQVFTGTVALGDSIEIWGVKESGAGTCKIKNMEIKFSWMINSIDGLALTAPIATPDTTPPSYTTQEPEEV